MGAPLVHRFRVTGRVQGVGFRWFVREQARALGLTGWVRNESDGSVVLEVAGPADAVRRLHTAVATGPAGAHVANVSTDERAESDMASLPHPFGVHR